MTSAKPIEQWPVLLEACVKACAHFHAVTVLRETDSTQDAAQRLRAVPGDIVTTFRQTAGRGRLGRSWADTCEHGIAVTFVVSADAPERLAMLSAVAVARAAAALLDRHDHGAAVGIRWPNDIVVAKRKLAGILVEQNRHIARVGVGVNIAQQSFPQEISDIACSLRQLGANVDRTEALIKLIKSMDNALAEPESSLERAYSHRDVLRGCTATFEHAGRRITGRVIDVDPTQGLRVATDECELFLPAATTSLLAMK